jgi:hypothetical protein
MDDKALREAIRREWAYTVPKQDLIDRIEELEAKLSDVEAERDALKGCVFLHMDLSNHHNAAKCPYCNPILQIQLDGNRAFKARAEAAEQLVATCEELEAKLAKAVEALGRIKRGDFSIMTPPAYVTNPLPSAQEIARTTLAELNEL